MLPVVFSKIDTAVFAIPHALGTFAFPHPEMKSPFSLEMGNRIKGIKKVEEILPNFCGYIIKR